MRIISEARHSLKSVLDAVSEDRDVVVIARRNGADAVVMSHDHYRSIVETMYLLTSRTNSAHLAASIAQYRDRPARKKPVDRG